MAKRSPMSSLQASRTLVKSPPELWAELSDLSSLARHLGEFGEIRITKVDPESRVEWEADRASGTVRLEPSGWGTRVVLTVDTPEPVAEPETEEEESVTLREAIAAAEAEAAAGHAAAAADDEDLAAPEDQPVVAPEVQPVAAAEAAPSPAAESAPEPQPAPKRGFWARLFGRRTPVPEPEPVIEEPVVVDEPEPEPVLILEAPEPVEERAFGTIEWEVPEPVAEEAEPEPDPAPVDPEAVLHGVLDTLGAAHHRPFSRS
jgi:hypothetical protein